MKVKGFTLMEVIIVLIITAIVITMSFSMFMAFSKQFHMYQKKSDASKLSLSLFHTLNRDFGQPGFAIYNKNSTLLRLGTPNGFIVYEFGKDFILRKYIHEDTLYKGRFTHNPSLLDSTRIASNNLITGIVLTLAPMSDSSMVFHFRKEYSSADFFGDSMNALISQNE